jgi:hypothetical protein
MASTPNLDGEDALREAAEAPIQCVAVARRGIPQTHMGRPQLEALAALLPVARDAGLEAERGRPRESRRAPAGRLRGQRGRARPAARGRERQRHGGMVPLVRVTRTGTGLPSAAQPATGSPTRQSPGPPPIGRPRALVGYSQQCGVAVTDQAYLHTERV